MLFYPPKYIVNLVLQNSLEMLFKTNMFYDNSLINFDLIVLEIIH